jgi:hypothetical protein
LRGSRLLGLAEQVRGDLLHEEDAEQRHHDGGHHQRGADHAQLQRAAPAPAQQRARAYQPRGQRDRPGAEPLARRAQPAGTG